MPLPRYQQLGVEVGGGTRGIDFPSRGEMTAGYNALAQTLQGMSEAFFKEAQTAAGVEGEKYGAENAPTPEQIAEARRLNQPIEPIGDARTYFGRAANKAATTVAAKNISVDAELELGKIQNDIAAGKIGINSITSRVNALASGYSSALRNFDPTMARSVEADITLHGNKMFLAAQKKAMAEGIAAQALKTADAIETTYTNDIKNIMANGPILTTDPANLGDTSVYSVQKQVDDAYAKVEARANSLPLKQRKEILKNLPLWAQTEVTNYINEKIVKSQSEEDLKPILQSLKKGDYDSFFTANPDNRVQLMNSLESHIRKYETADNRALQGLRDSYSKLPANINASIGSGKQINVNDIPSDDAIRLAFKNNPDRGDQVIAQKNESIAIYNAWQKYGYASEEELNAERSRLKQEQANAPLSEQSKYATTMSVFDRAYKARNEALQKDPASFAMGLPDVRDAYAAANNPNISPEARAKAWENYGKVMKSAQMTLGLPENDVKMLPKATIDSLNMEFDNQRRGGQDMATWLGNESVKWGNMWPDVMRQMNEKLPPMVSVIASMQVTNNQVAAAALSQSLAEPNKKAIDEFFHTKKDDLKSLNEAVDSEMKNFRASLSSPAIVDGPKVYEEWKGGVTQLAKWYVWNGFSPSESAKRAYNEAIGSSNHFESTYRIPSSVSNIDNIKDNLNIIKQNIDRYDFKVPPSVSNAYKNMPEETQKEMYYKSIMSTGRWVNTGNETGIRLVDANGSAVRFKDGSVFEFDFRELGMEIPRVFDPTIGQAVVAKGYKLPGQSSTFVEPAKSYKLPGER